MSNLWYEDDESIVETAFVANLDLESIIQQTFDRQVLDIRAQPWTLIYIGA